MFIITPARIPIQIHVELDWDVVGKFNLRFRNVSVLVLPIAQMAAGPYPHELPKELPYYVGRLASRQPGFRAKDL